MSQKPEHYSTILNHLMTSNQVTRPGAKRSAIWLIGQVLQQRRWADLAHRRPDFRASWTSLCFPYGRLDQSAKHASPENAKIRSNDSIWSNNALAVFFAAVLAVSFYVAVTNSAVAHGGGTNAQGCHLNHKTNRTHCHNKDKKKSKAKTSKTKATKSKLTKTKKSPTKTSPAKTKTAASKRKTARAKCKAGTIVDSRTNKCVKIVCEAGSRLNKKTNRCNKVKCSKGFEVNLKTNRCKKVAAKKSTTKKTTTKKSTTRKSKAKKTKAKK